MLKRILLMASLIGTLLLSNGFAEETMRLAIGKWDPYQSEHLKYYGVVSRIVTEAFALEGVKVKYGFFPWARSFEYAKHGDWDGTVAWAKKKDRIPFFYFSGWLIKDSAELFHLKSFKFQWTIGDFKTLKGVEIGATIGYNYGTSFQKEEKSGIIFVERVPSDEINFRKLLEGRIDVFPISLEVGYSILNRNFSKQEISLITHSPWGSVVDTNTDNNKYYLMFSKKVKKNKKLLMLFNKGLKRLRESGKYDQYFEESRREDYHQEIEKAYKVE